MDKYKNWYNVNGIFLDGMSYVSGNEDYYKHLSNYAKSLGLSPIIGNPGTDTIPSYVGTVDNLVIYDNSGLPSTDLFGGWHTNYDKSNFSVISYANDGINSTYVKNIIPYVQYMYISNSTMPNPFDTLPSQLDDLLTTLDNEQDQNGVSTQQKMGTITIDLMSINGEREDYHGVSLKIYHDNSDTLFQTISSITGNPYDLSLPTGHMYKIELYVSGMYSGVQYITLDSDSNELQFHIPSPGSILFNVVYNDRSTPINNATIMVRSNNGSYQYWTNSTTDNNGNSIRFWLQPTITDEQYYVATILTTNGLTYSYPFDILPSISTNVKIVTPWPSKLPIITVSVYKSSTQKITKSDGNFAVQLYDSAGNKVAESKVGIIGEVHFPGLEAGSYVFRVIDLNNATESQLSADKIILDGNQTDVQIFTNTTTDNIPTLDNASVVPDHIPSWVRNSAKWWAENQVSDSDFISGVQYLIQQHIVTIPSVPPTSDSSSIPIPHWVKLDAGLWAEGQISDDDFIRGVQYMISNGIMKISSDSVLMLADEFSIVSNR
uniref:spherulation-specific family 4 protein n=2 Tax=Candidatus Nitrosotalea sp. TS TaxID=2341020 RepID=UPI002A4E2B3D|nr:spherulation-specific family 4 protein [Candidatus Nitrosotalea sp. TS]